MADKVSRLLVSVPAAFVLPATMLKASTCANCLCLVLYIVGGQICKAHCVPLHPLRNCVCSVAAGHAACPICQTRSFTSNMHTRAQPAQAVDFAVAFSARETLFWRIFFEHLLAACKSAGESAAVFKRCVGLQERLGQPVWLLLLLLLMAACKSADDSAAVF